MTCSVAGVRLSLDLPAYQRVISNNSYTHDEQGDNPGQEKEDSTVSCINCDRCRHLDLAVSKSLEMFSNHPNFNPPQNDHILKAWNKTANTNAK